MTKAMNEWIFIIIGLVVVAISIYFYNTLKIFIVLGGFMCVYGLGKMSYNQMKDKMFPKDEEEAVDLNKVPNPYVQSQQSQQSQLPQQQVQHQRAQHVVQHRVQSAQHQQVQKQQQVQQYRQQPVQSQHSGKYCHSCGKPVHHQHKFCVSCGARLM
ncbi:MAG: hypothetical protein WC254_04440 [Candidatus Woesearchaeota archaeon]|jgi:preprotein translocase subunit SecF